MFRDGLFLLLLLFVQPLFAAEQIISDAAPLQMPEPGAHELRIISPTLLELTLITTKENKSAPVKDWNFVNARHRLELPPTNHFVVLADGQPLPVKRVGFKRRVLYAPLRKRDLRIGNQLYLELAKAIATNQQRIEVQTSDRKLWPATLRFTAQWDPLRWSPAIHVNQVGYLPALPKTAMIGYYLGSLGELNLQKPFENSGGSTNANTFQIQELSSGKIVFNGPLTPRADNGFPFACYQQVREADFSKLTAPGQYRLIVPGLGSSFPFWISDDVAGAFARTYALGIYHQRCGNANELPFTRFTHGACHIAPAEVPMMSRRYESVNDVLAQETEDAKENPRHTAPPLKNVAASLYPFVNKGPIDVRGGHHDAGDYSKYTANSATFIHLLVFAADNFPGVIDLDNLGLPESGDGKSDVLQEAKWEADFLAKMQDDDGGFYFLVYPRDRRYEDNVTPDQGDPQVVFPKTTAATAAATAALAQCASSPNFKKQFPEAAALYLEKAKKGWAFLERAIAKYGKDGAYQKITHYGNDFIHDDELAWAACEMFLATGDPKIHAQLLDWLNPADPETRKWSWWRLFEDYGHAIRDYAFAARSGRVPQNQLDPRLLELCENEIIQAGEDQLQRANNSAYGTSFPTETKATRTAGWYFSSDAAFDLAVAYQLNYPIMNDPRPKLLAALLSNLNFEAGCNPVNMCYLTGIGWKRQREIVHQYALNDRRVLPPSGIPLGNIQGGFGWMDNYGEELGALSFPTDDDPLAPYPFYDRWGDSFNLTTEFVISNQARGLAYLAWLMARTPLKNQKWKSAAAQITHVPATVRRGTKVTAELSASGLDLSAAQIVWETAGAEPAFGAHFDFVPTQSGPDWIEAEAELPDGRRVFGVQNFNVR
ncbi:MAG TPA: glycoside hydrolase family 9 protein [Verrucomicrobiae bacterium]|nr:glycoside hydrolase family 9 protein [Verrucomicrobiae bacterium]